MIKTFLINIGYVFICYYVNNIINLNCIES